MIHLLNLRSTAVLTFTVLTASWLASQTRLPADSYSRGLPKVSKHADPDRMLADTQQRLQVDTARAMQKLHAEATREFIQSRGNGIGRLTPIDTRSNILTLAAYPWQLPSWSEQELTDEKKLNVPDDLKNLHAEFASEFGGVTPFRKRKERAWQIKSLELVGLLMHGQPVVYVSEKIQMKKMRNTPTRDLDFFEATGLEQLRQGENSFLRERAGVIRMLGAIRARPSCVSCHQVEEGTLLGAFSYTVREAILHWTPRADVPRLKQTSTAKAALIELSKRGGPDVIAELARAAAKANYETKPFARALLDDQLYRKPVQVMRLSLRDEDAEIRQSAARVFPTKQPILVGALTDDLIRLVRDSDPDVRAAAFEALVKASNGERFGEAAGKDPAAIAESEAKWRDWWARKKREAQR